MRLLRLSVPLGALATLALAWPADDRDTARAVDARPAAALPHDRVVLALLKPERIASVDVRTGAVAQLRVPGGTLCRGPLRVVDGRILYLAPGRHGSQLMSVDLALRERPHRLARTDVLVPSPVPGHVWIASRTPGGHGHLLMQDLTVRSGAIARARRKAPSLPIVGAVSEGLVLQGRSGTFVWDPRTGRRTRGTPGPWLLGTHGSLLASCGGRCGTLLLADGTRGRLVHAPAAARFLPTGAAFSPDGSTLAAPLGPTRAPRLGLVDIARGARWVVPGVRLGMYAALAWSPGGTLYAAGPRGQVRTVTPSGATRSVGPRFAVPVMQLLAAHAEPEP